MAVVYLLQPKLLAWRVDNPKAVPRKVADASHTALVKYEMEILKKLGMSRFEIGKFTQKARLFEK